MKSLLKSSFMLILLMAVFNIGVNNAYAEEAKASEISKIENVETTSLECSNNILTSFTIPSVNSNAIMGCDPSITTLENGDTYIVTNDCELYVVTEDGRLIQLI